MFEGGVRVSISTIIKVKNLIIYPKIVVDYVKSHFPMATKRRNKNIRCLHGNIETFLMRYLRIFIFFQIKKPYEICQPNIQVKKANFHSKKNPDLPPPPKGIRPLIRVDHNGSQKIKYSVQIYDHGYQKIKYYILIHNHNSHFFSKGQITA
jgi:hypothetical protein